MKLTAAVLRERQLIASSLLRAISGVGWTEQKAADQIGIKTSTLDDWVNARVAIRVELVSACKGLRDAFRIAYCSHEHESLALLVRKPRGTRKGARHAK